MEVENLRQRQVPHLAQPVVQLLLLLQDTRGRSFEVSRRLACEIGDCSLGQLLDRDAETLRYLLQLARLVVWYLNRELHTTYCPAERHRSATAALVRPTQR